MSYLVTVLPLVLWLLFALIGCKKSLGSNMCTKSNSIHLKGLCSIVIIYVHIPAVNGNILQDAIGSFAYVCVTLFFFYSAYGMMDNVERTGKLYLNSFWKNRLSSLLIPCVIVNIISYGLTYIAGATPSLLSLLSVNAYVIVLLEWCVIFYFVQICRFIFGFSGKTANVIMAGAVVISSMIGYLCFESKDMHPVAWMWCYERIGLVWGIICFAYREKFFVWIGKMTFRKFSVFFIICLLSGGAYIIFKNVFFIGAYILKILTGVTIILLMALITANYSFENAFTFLLGKISFGTYLCHFSIIAFMPLLSFELKPVIYIPTVIIVTIILAYIVTIVSNPLIKCIRKDKFFI